MTVTENNPHKISQMGTGTSLAAITDASDFPHTGLIKGLSLMARQNIVVKGSNNSATHDFNITQSPSSSGNNNATADVIQVAQGSYLRDGKLYTASAANFSIGTTENATTLLIPTHERSGVAMDKGYHLLVINSSNALNIRQPTAANKVPDYTAGDTLIAIIEISSTTVNGTRNIQYLTSDKTSNSVSIAYDASNTYTEALSIESSASGDITIEGKVSNKDIIFKANDDGTPTEIMRIDSSVSRVGIGTTTPNAKLHITDSGSGDHLILEGTLGSSTTSAPNLVLFRNGADAAADIDDNDLIGQIVFRGENDNSTPQEVNYATIEAGMDDTTDGSEDGHITFNLIEDGTLTEFIRLRAATRDVVVNEQADDIDFRCEGSSNANLLFVDASSDSVGIGTTPVANSTLTVEGVLALDEVSAPTDTADYGQLYANADNDLHYMDGAGTDTPLLKGGKHTIWVPASAMYANTTAGCSALTQVELSNGPELKVLDFDTGSDEFAQFTVAFPKSWNEGTITFQPFWTISATGTNTVAWALAGVGFGNSDDINTAFGTAIAVDALAHSGTNGDMMVSAESSAVTISGASADSVTYFQINRNTSTDTHASDARLIGIKIFYDINAGNDE